MDGQSPEAMDGHTLSSGHGRPQTLLTAPRAPSETARRCAEWLCACPRRASSSGMTCEKTTAHPASTLRRTEATLSPTWRRSYCGGGRPAWRQCGKAAREALHRAAEAARPRPQLERPCLGVTRKGRSGGQSEARPWPETETRSAVCGGGGGAGRWATLPTRRALPKKSRWMARSARSIGVSAPASSSGSSAPLAKCPSAGGPGGAGGAAGAAPSEAAGAAEAAAAAAAAEAAALAEETYSLSREADDAK